MRKQLGVAPSNSVDAVTKAYVDANANPGQEISTAGTLTSLAPGDLLMALDVSDTSDGPAGTLKVITAANLGGGVAAQSPLTFNDSTTPYVGVPGVALGPRGGVHSIPGNEYRASLMVVFAPITLTEARISVETAGTAGTNCRLAIYEQDTADGKLGALVSDLGTLSIGSTGQKRMTGLSLSLDAGVYLVRAHAESTASLTWFAGYCPWWSATPLGNNNNPLVMFGGGLTYGVAEDPGNKASTEYGDVSGGAPMYSLVQFLWTVN